MSKIATAQEEKARREKERREEPDPVPDKRRGDPSSDIALAHPLDSEALQKKVSKANQDNDATGFFTPHLTRFLKQNPSATNIDISVTTVGEENVTTTSRYDAQAQTWKPTDEEIKNLSNLGSIDYICEYTRN